MKYFIVFSTVFLAGCGAYERSVAEWTGYSEICVDNVKYIQFTSGATVKYDQDGNVVKCRN